MLLARQLLIKCFSFFLLALTLLGTQQVIAGGVRVIQNPSFEIRRDGTPVTIPTPSGTTWYYWGDDTCVSRGSQNSCIAGWRTTDTGQYVEVGYASTYGGFGFDNNRIVAELNASSQSRLYQPICLQAAEVVTMNYYFSARLNAGGDPQQVTAGLWNINDTGPIGGALSSQNSNFSLQSSAVFAPQTAIFSAPADGLYQIGLEAVLPATGSNGNLIDDIRVILKPLVDLNTAPRFTMPEGTSGNSLQLRVNGTVQTPTVVALRKISGSASSDIDFTLGTPVGLVGTTPTISHAANSNLWLVTIPAGEYDAGQGIFGNAKYGIQIPVQSSYDVLREGTEPLIFELQTPGAYDSDPLEKWGRTNPICEGPSTNQVEAEIVEVLPVIKVNKNLIGRVDAADQFTTVIKDSLGNVVSSTASSLTSGGGVTTTGATTGVFTAAGKFEADFDQTYTITEVMAAGSVNTLSAYTSSISCTNARVIGVATTLPSGVGQTFTIAPKDADDINCTITNAPLPVLTLNKALASTRAAPTDQFIVQIKNGASVVNSTTNSTSTGAGSTITGGTTGATILQPSISYTFTEVGAGSPTADLSLYNTFIACTNSYAGSSTVLPSGNGQIFNITPQGNDNISCTLTNIAHQPRLTLQKALTASGRLDAADQFTVQINQGVSTLASGTTAGAGSTVTGGVAGPIFLSAGVNYTLTEVMAGGSVSALSAYNSRIVCTNTNGNTVSTFNGNSVSITPQLDDVISCTLTNGNPRLRINKTVSSVRNGTDRFTTQIRTGGAGGAVVSGTTASTTVGGGVLTTGGVGSYSATGYYAAAVGTVYTITEAISGAGSNIANYSSSISCTNANVGSSTVLPSGTAASFDVTPQFNDDINCTITNITHPRIAFAKALSTTRLANTDQFTMRLIGGATNVTTTTTGTGATVTTGSIAATQVVAGTSYALSEIAADTTNLSTYNSTIVCTNTFASSATTLPSGAGTSFNLTPQLGDDVSCTLTNGREPRIKLNKAIATGLVDSNDRFTTQIRDNTANKTILSTTSSNAQTGGAVTTTGGVGSYTAAGNLKVVSGTTYNLTEVVSAGTSGRTQYDTTISCTNNGVAMGSPSGSGQNFTITPATGDNIVCILTNSPKLPKIKLNKRISGVIDNVDPVDTFKTQIYNGATLLSDGNTATGTALTTNTSATSFPQTYSAVTAYTGAAGTTYTLTEAMNTGSTAVGTYSTFINCSNTRSDGPFTVLPDGAGQSFNITVLNGDDITCTLDNGPAQITVIKDLVNTRTNNTDQFTMQIKSSGGTVLNSLVSSTTAGQLDVVTPGSGTTDITYVAGGGTYTLTEVAFGGTTMTNYESRIDCTNAKVGSMTVLPSTPASTYTATQSWTVIPTTGDIIACTIANKRTAPRVRLTKALGGPRYAAADQFLLEVRDATNTTTVATLATTTGSGSTVNTGTGAASVTTGTTYTLRETMAAGSSSLLTDYITTYSCVNNATGATTSGSTTNFSFTAAKYDDLVCTFTNSPKPRIKVNKIVATGLTNGTDRFTTQIRTGGVSGAVVSGTTASATAGGGVLTTGGVATYTATGTYQGTAGTTYTITESASGAGASLATYNTSISCTNADTNSTTVLPSGTTPPFDITVQNGDSITCTLTNTPLPRLKVSKVVASIADATDRFTTQIRTGGVSGTVVSDTTASTTVGGGVLTTGGVATYTATGKYQATAGTTYTFTEILSAGASDISQYSNTLSCTNGYVASTTPLPTGAYPYEVTPQLGDDISCTMTNNVVAPKIRVQKTVVALADIDDRFITQIRTGGVSGTVVSNPNSSATVGGGVFTTGGAGTYPTLGVYVATFGTTYTFTEVFAAGTSGFSQYTTSMSCTNARSAGPVTTLPSGSTAPFNVTPKAGDDITCTLSNDIIQPKINVSKIVSSLVDGADRFTTQVRTGGVAGIVVSDITASTTTGGGVLTTGGVATYSAAGNYQGVMGTTYTLTEVLTAGSSDLANQYDTAVACINTRPNGPTTVLPTGSIQPFNIVAQAGDDISCTLTNTVRQPKLRIHKTVSSLVDANDRFTTEVRLVSDSSLQSGTSASTTTGGGVLTTGGVATYNATGSFQGVVGTAYNVTESISAGTSVLSQYTTAIACTNAFATSSTVLPAGQSQPFNVTANYGDDISCTLTNSIKQPVIRVHKTVSSLVDVNDRFTTQVRTGGVSGTVVSDTSSSLTIGGGVVTTGGLTTDSATGTYQAVIGTTYTMTEAVSAGTSALSQYNTSISCSNARVTGLATTLPTGSTQPFNIVPKAGDDISCILTNSVKQPLVRVHKVVSSLVDANDRFTTEIRNGAAVVSGTGSSATLDGGVLTTGGAATYNATGSYQATIGTSYLLTESISAGTSALSQYNTSISCSNARVTGLATTLPTGSGQSFALTTKAGDDISCTLTNSIKQPIMRVNKVVLSLVNSADRFTTEIRTGGVSGTVVSSTSSSATLGGGVLSGSAAVAYIASGSYQAAIGTTYTLTEIMSAGTSLLSQYVTSIDCSNARTTGLATTLPSGSTQPFDVEPKAGDDITCRITNAANNYSLQGKVFLDNGKGIATPHNGVQEAGELGIGNITMTLTDCAATTYQTVLTDGAGAYSFAVPNSLTTGATLCVEEHQPSTLVSVTGAVGTTAGAYSLASDRTQFTLTVSTNYTGINFGDVAESQLTGTGSQTISAGTTANYVHQFIAGTEGIVTLTTAQAPSPSLSGWTSLMYLDATCDAQLNAGDTQITAPISVVADQLVCLIQKVQSPVTATNGAMDISTVSASFAFAAPSMIIRPYSQPDTTTIMDASLVLIKRVREVSSCPSTGADVNPFTTNNQALPNALIEYQIMYSNPSASTLSNITVHDMTPAFTEFRSASCTTTPSSLLCAIPSSGSGTAPSIGGVGDINWVLTDNPTGLGAGQGGEVRFCVRISP